MQHIHLHCRCCCAACAVAFAAQCMTLHIGLNCHAPPAPSAARSNPADRVLVARSPPVARWWRSAPRLQPGWWQHAPHRLTGRWQRARPRRQRAQKRPNPVAAAFRDLPSTAAARFWSDSGVWGGGGPPAPSSLYPGSARTLMFSPGLSGAGGDGGSPQHRQRFGRTVQEVSLDTPRRLQAACLRHRRRNQTRSGAAAVLERSSLETPADGERRCGCRAC